MKTLTDEIAYAGGLYTISQIGKVCGRTARDHPRRPGFPEPVWTVGATKLYAGWAVYHYFKEKEKWTAAEHMKGECQVASGKS